MLSLRKRITFLSSMDDTLSSRSPLYAFKWFIYCRVQLEATHFQHGSWDHPLGGREGIQASLASLQPYNSGRQHS